MLKLKFNLRHQDIQLVNKGVVVATDSKDYLVAKFNTISDDWETPLTAVFTDDKHSQPYAVIVGADERLAENECFVPWEVLTDAANVYVSVYCGNLHTTITAAFKVRKSGYIEGETPPPPSPTVYEQILESLQNKQDSLTAGDNITITDNIISANIDYSHVAKFLEYGTPTTPDDCVEIGTIYNGYVDFNWDTYTVDVGTYIVSTNWRYYTQYFFTVDGQIKFRRCERVFNPDSGEFEYVNWTKWSPIICSLSEQDKQDIADIVLQRLQGGD